MKCAFCDGKGKLSDIGPTGWLNIYICPDCNGTGKIEDPPSAPTLADVVALLERQAKTCERIAKALDKIAFIAKDL